MSRRSTAKKRNAASSMIIEGAQMGSVSKAPSPRAPVASNTPVLLDLGNQKKSPLRGTTQLLQLYSQAPWLRAIVGKISRAVAEIPFVLLAKPANKNATSFVFARDFQKGDGSYANGSVLRAASDNSELLQIDDHPLLTMLERGTGDPRLPGFGVIQITSMHLDLIGEAFWLLERDAIGTPIGAWPLPPSWVSSLPSEKDPFFMVSPPGGTPSQIPVTEVVAFIDPDPLNPYGRGTGIARSLDDEIQIDEFAAKHQKSFFLNRARPDIIISGQFISAEDAKRLEKQWLADHQGFWKAFKPLFFSQKIDIKELSQSFESMQMVQIRKHERDTFISIFGAPPEKFGIINESKRSTINAADYFWAKDVIKPRIETIRRVLQLTLVPMFDERLILGYVNPVIQDEEMRNNLLRYAGYNLTINEWRRHMGWPGLGPAGEALMVPKNYQIVPLKGTAEEMAEYLMNAAPVDSAVETEAMIANAKESILAEVRDTVFSSIREFLRPKREAS